MNLGLTIKDLRMKKKLTQEQLADFLNVSVQSISRWETSVNYPDITMLPILANIFDVTTDHLLGVDLLKNKEEVEDILQEVQDFLHIGHLDDAIISLRKGINKFPNNYNLLLKLCETLNFHQNKIIDYLNESISISEKILDTTTDESFRKRAVSCLFYAYFNKGDKKSTRRIYDTYIANNINVDHYANLVLEGDELINYVQTDILIKFQKLWSNLMTMRKLDMYTDEEKIILLDKFNQLTSIFFENDDLGFYNWSVFSINEKISFNCANIKDKELTFKYLDKAIDYAIKYDARPDVIYRTSLLVNKTKDLKSDSTTNGKGNCCFELLEDLKHKRFDFIREESKFNDITNKLKEYAKEF